MIDFLGAVNPREKLITAFSKLYKMVEFKTKGSRGFLVAFVQKHMEVCVPLLNDKLRIYF